MKFCALTLLMLVAFASRASLARADGGTIGSAECNGWFEAWKTRTKASIATEAKVAQGLNIDKRSSAEIETLVDSIAGTAKLLCARLDNPKVKAAPPGLSAADNCTDAFKKWEDERDNSYSVAIFEKKLEPEEEKKFIPAQDIARREAKLGKQLCRALEYLH